MTVKKAVYIIEFWAPGTIVGENWRKERKNPVVPEKVKWPDNAYCFSVSKRTDIVEGKNVYKGKTTQVGPLYYHPDSRVEDYEAVCRNPNSTKILIDNMRCNKWNYLVWSRWGNWPQPFDPKKHKVLPKK